MTTTAPTPARPAAGEKPGHPDGLFASIDEVPARIRDIALFRGLGYTYREIAQPLGVTPQAVSLMLIRHKRRLQRLKRAHDLQTLSSRAVNVLGRHGITNREEARRHDLLSRLDNERNCGTKTRAEIERWMAHGNESVESF